MSIEILPQMNPRTPLTPHSPPAVRGPLAGAGGVLTTDDSVDWQHVWLSVDQHAWKSLAVVPANPGLSSVETVRRLASAADFYSQTPVEIIDASVILPSAARDVTARIAAANRQGIRCLVAVGSPVTSPAAISLARAAGAALLVLPLGVASVRLTRQTVDAIGKEHFIGAITLGAV